MKLADRIGGLLLLALAVFVYGESRTWEYTTDGIPGPGFAPFWVSLLIGIAAVAVLARSWRTPLSGPLIPSRPALWRSAGFLLGMLGAACLIPLLGMSLTLGLFVLVAIPFLGAREWWKIVLVAILVAAGVPFFFERILLVPLPAGPLGF
jgi:hypothetical protein